MIYFILHWSFVLLHLETVDLTPHLNLLGYFATWAERRREGHCL